ncbi:restriction endonuclease subunit S [Desulfonatronum lacustre]|uniref:restriction endonuclease subunit S n=1 Tax=Desulfonatronum lacustre TaxID=66849 RepID=UPI00048C8DE7|nr:restriction endonuclease subunit S [Desulfonatronum lacustre]
MNELKPGWRMVKFGDIAQNVAVRVDPADAKTDVYVGLEHLDPSTIHLRQWGHPSDVTGQKLTFKKGDVIFGRRRAYQRKLAVAEFDGICSAHAMVIRAIPTMILPDFLPFFLQSDVFMKRAIEISVGSLSPTINWKTLQVEEFPLPPLDEQKRIAEILWAADEAASAYQEALNNIHTVSQFRFEHTLETLNCPEMSLPEVLSGSPESGCSAPPSSDETGHWVLSLAALSANGYVRGNLKPVTKTNKMSRATLYKGDLLISRSNTVDLVGFAGIFDEDRADVSFPDTMMRLPVNTQKAFPAYLELVLLSNRGRRHMMKTASGTSNSMKKINRKTLAEFRFPVPNIYIQKKIVSEFNDQKRYIGAIANHVSKTKRMLSLFSNETIGTAHV